MAQSGRNRKQILVSFPVALDVRLVAGGEKMTMVMRQKAVIPQQSHVGMEPLLI